MKKILLYILLPLTLVGCNDWLTVSSDDELLREDVFSTYEGHRAAINGIYREISADNLYGSSLSWGMVSALGQNYNSDRCGTTLKKFQEYDYENSSCKSKISSTWLAAHRVIANCNSLIADVETRSNDFFSKGGERERNMILGEAMAVRALLHFEMLRLFAPAPIKKSSGHFIPYVDKYPSQGEERLTVDECMSRVIEDFTVARQLLIPDTLELTTPYARFMTMPDSNGEIFFSTRGTRLNYFAVTALLARAYMYNCDKVNALKYAQDVLTWGPDEDSEHYFWFDDTWDLNYGDFSPKLICDLILAFHNTKQLENYSDFKKATGARMYLKNITQLYSGDESDIRKTLFIKSSGESKKWASTEDEAVDKFQCPLQPVIRLSEMYYIAAEAIFDTDPAKAIEYLNTVKDAREAIRVPSDLTSRDEFMSALWQDATREFMVEGETFFLYKRLDKAVYNGDTNINVGDKFVLPLPENELVK